MECEVMPWLLTQNNTVMSGSLNARRTVKLCAGKTKNPENRDLGKSPYVLLGDEKAGGAGG
jgi:hypothetical protein